VIPQWFTLPHQINATLPNIVANDTAYFGMRAVQFFLPGEPQVYYVGLFNGMDDRELFARSGQGRDTNRHNYTVAEIQDALQQPVTRAIVALARLRKHNAFEGSFSWAVLGNDRIELRWDNDDEFVSLEITTSVDAPAICIKVSSASGVREFCSVEEFAAY
jgi:sucrose phosphorylase